MARMKPDTFEYSNTGSAGENRVFESLRDNLDDKWLVCHSWRWLRHPANIRTDKTQGEGDFIAFHPDCGIIVIEVKGGTIEYRNDGKYYTNNILIQNPEKQASDTKFDLVARIKEKGFGKSCYVSHCVWFPDIRWNIEYPPNLSSKSLFDESDLTNPEEKLKALAPSFHERITDLKLIQGIEGLLHTTFKLVKSLRFKIEDTVKEELRLTQEQLNALEYLNEEKCIGIKGRAGTGKTLLAMHRATQIAQEGYKVLYLCYNKGLANHLQSTISPQKVDVYTYHQYAKSYLERHKPWRINFEDTDAPIDFDCIANEFAEVIDENLDLYTVCIIDEAQDLKPEWFLALKDAFINSGRFYFFFDPLQILYTKSIELHESHFDFGKLIIPLYRNMRNTKQVSMASLNVMGVRYNNTKHFTSIEGDFPKVIMCLNNEKQEIEQRINVLLNVEHIKRETITILSMEASGMSSIGEDIYGIPVTTFRKFKGLENEVVLIVDVNYSHLIDEVYQRELYAALTRSRYLSEIYFDNSPCLMKKAFCKRYELTNPDKETIYSLLKVENYE